MGIAKRERVEGETLLVSWLIGARKAILKGESKVRELALTQIFKIANCQTVKLSNSILCEASKLHSFTESSSSILCTRIPELKHRSMPRFA